MRYTVTCLGRKQGEIIVDLQKRVDFPELNVDIVVHAAGKAHTVPTTETESKAFYEVNLEGTKNLCEAIARLKQLPKAFIFISTVAVYGLDVGKNIGEDHSLDGDTPYAKSKILAEQWLLEWCRIKNIQLSILRLPLIAGPTPPGNLGTMIQAIKTGKYLSIGRADAQKSIVWAADIAHIIPQLAEVGGVYNLTDGYHPTFGELEGSIAHAIGRLPPLKIPLWVAKILGYAGDLLGSKSPINSNKLSKITSTLTFNDKKARETLGWAPNSVLDKIHEIV